jgi:hypothetical protein
MRKSWYDPEAAEAVRTVSEVRSTQVARRRHLDTERESRLGACLIYPLRDGPGIVLLLLMPPFLLLLSLPVFDWIAIVDPFRRADWALGLLALPIFLPLMFAFAMVFGYCLLVLGQMLVASALGEYDHPAWPEWDGSAIAEGIGRWVWAFIVGVALGVFPTVAYWISCGTIDWFDRVVFADLVLLGTAYAQVALAASLLHDSLLAANPVTVLIAIGRLGWDCVQPCVSAGVAMLMGGGILWSVFFVIPTMKLGALALWGFWIFALYAAMVVFRMLGLTYHAHERALHWFRNRPRWATSSRAGRLYSNS